MKHKIACTVIGDAMIDIVFPLLNEEDIRYIVHGGVTSIKSTISPGGTANVAVGISQLGSQSAFIGKVGNDCFGKYIENDLKTNNVKTELPVSSDYNTGMVFVLILPNKERFFVVDRGANAVLEEKDVNFDTCINSRYLYISGYSFQDKKTYHTIRNVIEESSNAGVNIVFNTAAPNIAKKYRKKILNIIRNRVDIVILNEKEGEKLFECSNDGVISELFSYGVEKVALTMGAKGSVVATPEKTHRIKAYHADVVDTTGAGDAYASAFIYGLQKGWNEEQIGEFASNIASKVVSKLGARFYDCR